MYLKITCIYYHTKLGRQEMLSFIGPFDRSTVDKARKKFSESLILKDVTNNIEVVLDATSWERYPPTALPEEFAEEMSGRIELEKETAFI